MTKMTHQFKKPLVYDPTLAERTLEVNRQKETAARSKKANMLAELGLADEEFDMDDDEEDEDDLLSDDERLSPAKSAKALQAVKQTSIRNKNEKLSKEFISNRCRMLEAMGLEQYIQDLQERANQSLLTLQSDKMLQFSGNLEVLFELQQEIEALLQDNSNLQRQVNSSNTSPAPHPKGTPNGFHQNGESADVISLRNQLKSASETIDKLQGRISQLELSLEAASRSSMNGSARQSFSTPSARQSENGASQQAVASAEQAAAAANSKVAAVTARLEEERRQHEAEVKELKEALARAQREAETRAKAPPPSSSNNAKPMMSNATVSEKLQDLYKEVDALHLCREGVLRELVAMQKEIFSPTVMTQMTRLVRDKEVSAIRKIKSEVRGQLDAAVQRAAEAEDNANMMREEMSDKLRILELESAGRIKQLQEKWRGEFEKRKKLHNLVSDLKGSIRVLCRVRPFLEKEKAGMGDGSVQPIKVLDQENVRVTQDKGEKDFEFDRVFSPAEGQEALFEEVSGLVVSVLDGYNVCIMAYGQTGSGKTYTMEGPESDPGVNTRALRTLFQLANERSDYFTYAFAASVLEIYNEQIYDLLAGGRDAQDDKLDVKQGPEGMYVPGLKVEPVDSMDSVAAVILRGKSNRSTFATNMNEHSSRSHLVLSVYITATNKSNGNILHGKLHLIDLAGSERLSRTNATGDRLKEAQAINKSLSSLGDVIQALQERSKHVPYRNSKLTRLLEDSLGGSAKTVMVVNTSPAAENAGETKCSLEFASRARKVELGRARANVTVAGGEGTAPARSVESAPPSRAASPALATVVKKPPLRK